MPPILQVKQLHKQFNQLKAVNGVSFDVGEGTVEMLEGIKRADAGQILYRGSPLNERFKNRAGIMFQSTALQDFITVQESLELFQCMYPQTVNLQQVIDDCALGDFLHQQTASLSGGQRQRVLLAIALINDPDIIFLDEPTTGLDPQARHNFWQLIHKIKQQNKTLVLTTHYMDEAYELCDEIIIMDRGQIIAQGTPRDLLATHFNDVIVQMPFSESLQTWLGEMALNFSRSQNVLEIRTADVDEMVRQLQGADIRLSGLQIRARTLDDLFLELTGKALRQ